MKKLLAFILSITMVITGVAALTSCDFSDEDFADDNGNKNTVKYVAIDATDLIAEDFGIAVKKGNTELLNMINQVVEAWVTDGTMHSPGAGRKTKRIHIHCAGGAEFSEN